MTRPDRDAYFMEMVQLVAKRATCVRRQVGCILVSNRGHLLATGYNGVPSGFPHCTDQPCEGATAKSGESLDSCLAIHAEQNALLQCQDVTQIETAYITTSPCVTCTKLLMNTSCKRIIFSEEYPHSRSKEIWRGAWIEWFQHD